MKLVTHCLTLCINLNDLCAHIHSHVLQTLSHILSRLIGYPLLHLLDHKYGKKKKKNLILLQFIIAISAVMTSQDPREGAQIWCSRNNPYFWIFDSLDFLIFFC